MVTTKIRLVVLLAREIWEWLCSHFDQEGLLEDSVREPDSVLLIDLGNGYTCVHLIFFFFLDFFFLWYWGLNSGPCSC
jgi:hypothetical protein